MREDFKKKVTLALKKAAEVWGCEAEGDGKKSSLSRGNGGGVGGQRPGGVTAYGLFAQQLGSQWGWGLLGADEVRLESAAGRG